MWAVKPFYYFPNMNFGARQKCYSIHSW